jgi:hypothetical protein
MRKAVLAALVALLVPTASFAQFQVGARIGFAPSGGTAYEDKDLKAAGDPDATSKMSDGLKSQIPIQLEGSYKLNRDFAAGVYVSYGIAQVGSKIQDQMKALNPSASVSAKGLLRVGLQGLYAFNDVKAPLTPWVGVGLGYEQGGVEAKFNGGGKFEETASGYDLSLQAGGDYKVTDQFTVGPYVMLSVGQFTSVKDKISGFGPAFDGTQDVKINSKFHEWFGFGVAGKFNL